jgi:molybdate transport system substrate-binding protein
MPTNIKLLSAGAVSPGLVQVVAAFRRETGHDVKVSFATAPELRKRLGSGESADVVIAPADLLDPLVKTGKAAADWITLGRIGVGVMVRSGGPPPKIATVEEFKQSLLSAESIVYNQASTGVYLESLFERLGTAAPVKAKTTRYPDFASVLGHVRAGKGREIGFGATTVIIESASKGVIFVGPLPEEIQNYTTYGAALNAQNNFSPAPVEFLAYLTQPGAKSILAAAGIASS